MAKGSKITSVEGVDINKVYTREELQAMPTQPALRFLYKALTGVKGAQVFKLKKPEMIEAILTTYGDDAPIVDKDDLVDIDADNTPIQEVDVPQVTCYDKEDLKVPVSKEFEDQDEVLNSPQGINKFEATILSYLREGKEDNALATVINTLRCEEGEAQKIVNAAKNRLKSIDDKEVTKALEEEMNEYRAMVTEGDKVYIINRLRKDNIIQAVNRLVEKGIPEESARVLVDEMQERLNKQLKPTVMEVTKETGITIQVESFIEEEHKEDAKIAQYEEEKLVKLEYTDEDDHIVRGFLHRNQGQAAIDHLSSKGFNQESIKGILDSIIKQVEQEKRVKEQQEETARSIEKNRKAGIVPKKKTNKDDLADKIAGLIQEHSQGCNCHGRIAALEKEIEKLYNIIDKQDTQILKFREALNGYENRIQNIEAQNQIARELKSEMTPLLENALELFNNL